MVGKAKALQFSPLRNAALLDAAIRELAELDRVQLLQDGRRKIIKVNPALLEVAQ